ncbi:lysophospholipid acyltransferase family protein [Nocardia salmonicida]
MNEGAKVIRLDVNVEARQRPQTRRWPDQPMQAMPVTSLSERRPGMPALPPKSLTDIVLDAVGEQIERTAEFARRRLTGDYQVDEFGYDRHLLESVILPTLRPLSEYWFRAEVTGIENVPAVGGALLVANHAGTVPLDGLMLQLAVHDKHPNQRALRLLAADLIFEMPLLGALARKAGHTMACHPDAERLLRSGHIAGVFPEGFKGVGKNYADRYKLQRFGRGGFVSAAVRAGVPIIPVSIVGSEEIYPKLADIKPLARLLGLPYFPVTPLFPHLGLLGAVPMPSKWYIEFGEPIATTAFEPEEADDPMTMFEVTDQVRETIQQTLYKLLAKRRNVVLG